VYWSAADPGWAYGLYTAAIAPLALGLTSHMQVGGFSVDRTLELLARERITNFAAAPTVYRALRAAEVSVPPLSLRCASSAGEPLTPEVNVWAREALGVEVHDHYGLTELGMVIGHHQHEDLRRPLKPGCMGRALPGWDVAVLEEGRDVEAPDNVVGRLVVDARESPLMTFRGYVRTEDTAGKFTADGRWYVTGDAAWRDEDGDLHFSSRDDDVIIMAGYRIGPFDIESVLLQHEAVAECAVIAVPDEIRGELIEAAIVLRAGHEASDELAHELQDFVKRRYAAHAFPRSIRFYESLPKTPSGKIQRFVLRRQRSAELAANGSAG
jgi:acetyl-CoA synthetase